MSASEIEFRKVAGMFTSAFVPVVKVTEVSGGKNAFSALVYQCKMNVDWDGSPWAYGRDNPRDARPPQLVWDKREEKDGGQKYVRERKEDHFQRDLKPLEFPGFHGSLRDATFPTKDAAGNAIGFSVDNHPFEWVGVVSATRKEASDNNLWIDDRANLRDRFGKFPVIQKVGPSRGYYVSQTPAAISAAQKQATPGWKFLQSSYWDATAIPYCVWPSMLGHGVRKGDFGLVIANTTGRSAGFFFADTGSTNKLGECSGHLVTTVAGSPLQNDAMVTFMVFPGSGSGDSRQGQEAFVDACVKSHISKLSDVPNAEELITFLSLGANPDAFNKAGYGSIKSKDVLPTQGTPAATYENVRYALKQRGFHSARKPLDINATSSVLP